MSPGLNELFDKTRPLAMELLNVGCFFPKTSMPMGGFKALNESLNSMRGQLIERLGEEWVSRFEQLVLGSVEEGIVACYYHLTNVESIESDLLAAARRLLEQRDVLEGQPGSFSMTLRPTRLTYEYQAFVFAVRRTLEYFAKSVGAFFGCEVKGIRHISKNKKLLNAEPLDLSQRVMKRLSEALGELHDVLPADGSVKSVRDTLAHYRHVEAGEFYIIRPPGALPVLGLAGGAEKLPDLDSLLRGGSVKSFGETLHDQVARIESLVFSVYSAMGLLPSLSVSAAPNEHLRSDDSADALASR